jgi:hypothetical protein
VLANVTKAALPRNGKTARQNPAEAPNANDIIVEEPQIIKVLKVIDHISESP